MRKTLAVSQSATLKVVLAINAATFLVMVATALYANSSAFLSESLDNLGDALTYGISLYAVSLGAREKTRVSFFKGALILLAALVDLAQIGYRGHGKSGSRGDGQKGSGRKWLGNDTLVSGFGLFRLHLGLLRVT